MEFISFDHSPIQNVWKHGSLVAFSSIPTTEEEKFRSPNMLSFFSYPIFLTRKLSQCKASEQGHKTITYSAMKMFDQGQFLKDLECQPWVLLDIYDDPNDAMDFFNKLFENVLNRHAPKKTKRVKHVLLPNWFTKEIDEAGKNRDFCKKRNNMNSRTDSGEIKPKL